jgi:hypothetical protein
VIALAKKDKEKEKEKEAAPAFTKQQLLSSKKYRGKQDLIDSLLKDDQSYTLEVVDNLVDKFRKGKVK